MGKIIFNVIFQKPIIHFNEAHENFYTTHFNK